MLTNTGALSSFGLAIVFSVIIFVLAIPCLYVVWLEFKERK